MENDPELDQFVEDGFVKAAASVFPIELKINSAGQSPVRLVIVHKPDETWWALAWASSAYTGQPQKILMAEIRDVHQLDIKGIRLTAVDGREIIATPTSRGGCCGNRLKNWNPFSNATLTHMAYFSLS